MALGENEFDTPGIQAGAVPFNNIYLSSHKKVLKKSLLLINGNEVSLDIHLL